MTAWRQTTLPGNRPQRPQERFWKRRQAEAIRIRDSAPQATYREYRGNARLTDVAPGLLAKQLLGARIVR